jgi:hypothetical protein
MSGNIRGGRGDGRGGGRGGRGAHDHMPANFPPPKELQEKAAMQKRTRVVEGPTSMPSQLDVQDLLAAIAKIERKEQTQVASQRLTPKDESHKPRSSPTRRRLRLSKVLDSLANLCISETNHEVIATALRIKYKAGSI